MQKKRCGRCGELQPHQNFSNCQRYGRQGWCKDCFREYQQERLQSPEQKQRRRLKQAEYYLNHKEAFRAKESVGQAVKNGKRVLEGKVVTRPVIFPRRWCEACGTKGQTVAHHWNGYSKEAHLDIIYLCRSCHRIVHIYMNEAKAQGMDERDGFIRFMKESGFGKSEKIYNQLPDHVYHENGAIPITLSTAGM